MALLNIQKIAAADLANSTSITVGAASTGRLLVAMWSQVRNPPNVTNCSINAVAGNIVNVVTSSPNQVGIAYWFDSDLPAAGTYPVTSDGTDLVAIHLFYAENAPQIAPTIQSNVLDGVRNVLLAGANADYVKMLSTVLWNTTPAAAVDANHTNLAAAIDSRRLAVINEGPLESVGWLDSGSDIITAVAFTTAAAVIPTLSLPTQDSVTHNSATVGVTTDQVDGDLYAVVSALEPTAPQVRLGQDSTGVAASHSANKVVAGTDEAITITGLTAETSYNVWLVQTNTAGDSLVVNASVTTAATPKSATVAGITGGASLTGLDYAVFAGHDISTMTLLTQGAGASINVSGDLVIDLTGLAGINGDPLLIVLGDWTTTVTGANKAAVCYTTMSVG